MELTKRKLKELSASINAKYLGSNVYDYENDIILLERDPNQIITPSTISEHNKNLQQLLLWLNNTYGLNNFKNNYKISCKQLAYSHGVYGNNGQIHKCSIYSDDYVIYTFYVCYY